MKLVYIALTLLLLQSCNSDKYRSEFDETGEELVKLILISGTFDADLVDSYIGKFTIDSSENYKIDDLISDFEDLKESIKKLEAKSKSQKLRKNYQLAVSNSVWTRLRILNGEYLSFLEECENIYQYTPRIYEISYFDSLLTELDSLLPGKGELRHRLADYKNVFKVKSSKVNKSFNIAIERAAEITKKHINLPESEEVEIEYLNDAPWSAYNWYKGNFKSLIQINKLSEVYVERVIDLAAHESYPGHHVYYTLREKQYYLDSGFVEFSVYPLYSPVSFLAEGTAEYCNDLVFPDNERIEFLKNEIAYGHIYTTKELLDYFNILEIKKKLNGIIINVTKSYLDDEIDRDKAAYFIQKYSLESSRSSYRRIDFIERYRAYVITYISGKRLVSEYIEKKAGSNLNKRWEVYKELLTNPYLPKDLE